MVSAPQTPQAAALAFLQRPNLNSHAIAQVAAQTSRYAVVRISRAQIEGQNAAGQILVKKFSFGWQAIDLNGSGPLAVCSVETHGVPPLDLASLRPLLGTSQKDCPKGVDAEQRDVGPVADVEAVRAKAIGFGQIIPFVRVVGSYAFMEWWGFGGGESFYKKTSTGWKMFAGGGGAYLPEELHNHYGVPLSVAHALLRR